MRGPEISVPPWNDQRHAHCVAFSHRTFQADRVRLTKTLFSHS